MPTPLVNALLTEHSQFHPKDSRYNYAFNHEAIAILVKHALKEQYAGKQIFVLAGSEDLLALLPCLTLRHVGDTAFILIRPYIHSMALILRKEQDNVKGFLFDSQAWGTRYYPTRLIILALQRVFPGMEMILSGTTVQAQDSQVGCTEYTLSILKEAIQVPELLFEELASLSKKSVSGYPYTARLTAWPSSLFMPQESERTPQHESYSAQLETLLSTHYSTNGILDRSKIETTMQEMQGCSLLNQEHYFDLLMYAVKVDLTGLRITVSFNSKEALYSNFLIYSNQIYPNNVTLETSHFVLNKVDGITVTYQAGEQPQLIYTFSCQKTLFSFPRLLQQASSELCQQQMRQQLALEVLSKQLKQKIAIASICQNQKGGFGLDQIQLILRHIFLHDQKIYVPLVDELSSDVTWNIHSEYRYIAFGLQSDRTHQVGVWVELVEGNPSLATVYNSMDQESIEPKYLERLYTLLGKDCQIRLKPSFYQKQTDDWSCGLFIIANLTHPLVGLSAEVEELLISDKRPILAVQTKLREYYKIYITQAGYEEKLHAIRHREVLRNGSCQQALKEILGTNDLCPSLRDFLNQESHSHASQSCSKTLEAYQAQYPKDATGRVLLQLSSLYATPETAKENILAYLALQRSSQGVALSQEEIFALEELPQYIGVETKEISVTVLHDLLAQCLVQAEPDKILQYFFQITNVDFEAFKAFKLCKEIASVTLLFQATQCLIKELAEKDISEKNEQLRFSQEKQLRESQLAEHTIQMQEILLQHISLFSLKKINIEKCTTRIKINIFEKYFKNRKFFPATCSEEKKVQVIMNITDLLEDKPFCFSWIYQQFSEIPCGECIALYETMLQTPEDLGQTIDRLPAQHWGQLIAAYRKNTNGSEDILDNILNALPHISSPKQLSFVAVSQYEINSFATLETVLKLLSPQNRLQFAQCYANIIRDVLSLGNVLELIPADQQLEWLSSCHVNSIIRHGPGLAVVLSSLSPEHRYEFARRDENKIKIQNAFGLADVLSSLSPEHQLEFAKCHEKTIHNASDLAAVLSSLSPEHQLEFAKCHEKTIHNASDLEKVIQALSSHDDRLVLARYHTDTILQASDLVKVLVLLSPEHRLKFSSAYKDKIQNFYHLKNVIQVLPSKNQFEFAKCHEKIIQNISDLTAVLKCLPDENRFDFAERHADKIQDILDLGGVMGCLPSERQLNFAERYENKIQNYSVTGSLFKFFKPTEAAATNSSSQLEVKLNMNHACP